MMNWIIIILFSIIIFKNYRILRDMEIKTKNTIFERLSLLIGIGAIIYIIYTYGNEFVHYLLGGFGLTIFIIYYLKSGITSKGFSSINLGAQFIPWDKVSSIQVNKGKSIEVSYSGNGFSNSLYFDSNDYEKILEILNEKLTDKLIRIS